MRSILSCLAVLTWISAGEAEISVPDPFICMYGHHDGAGVDDAFSRIIPPFSVVEGVTTDTEFVKELWGRGVVYAYHVAHKGTEDAATLVANWRAPFDNNLKGKLPGGFDAIAIDELRGADTDGTAQSNRVCAALNRDFPFGCT